MTEWRDIPGYEGIYKISDDGEIYSLPRVVRYADPNPHSIASWSGRYRKQRLHRCGLYTVTLHREGVRTTYYVHNLVLLAFVGPCPEMANAVHLNGCLTDNRLENLAYQAYQLTSDDIQAIRGLLAEGHRQEQIAARFGVHSAMISQIRSGRSYRNG